MIVLRHLHNPAAIGSTKCVPNLIHALQIASLASYTLENCQYHDSILVVYAQWDIIFSFAFGSFSKHK